MDSFGVRAMRPRQLDAAVEAMFAQSAAARALGTATAACLMKPNLLAKHAPEQAVTTHPAVVAAVRPRRCGGVGVKRITVADSPGGLYNPAVMRERL